MNSGATTLLCFALPIEARPFGKETRRNERCGILVTGMGRENARTALLKRLEGGLPARVFSCGFAGALNPALHVGDVVFEVGPESELGPALTSAGACAGRFSFVDKVVVSAAEKRALRESTGADAVDMESGAIAEVCRGAGVEFGIVRVVSDACDEDLPLDFNRFSGPDHRIDLGRLAFSVVFRPAMVFALIKWRQRLLRAAENLAKVLVTVTRG